MDCQSAIIVAKSVPRCGLLRKFLTFFLLISWHFLLNFGVLSQYISDLLYCPVDSICFNLTVVFHSVFSSFQTPFRRTLKRWFWNQMLVVYNSRHIFTLLVQKNTRFVSNVRCGIRTHAHNCGPERFPNFWHALSLPPSTARPTWRTRGRILSDFKPITTYEHDQNYFYLLSRIWKYCVTENLYPNCFSPFSRILFNDTENTILIYCRPELLPSPD